MGLAVVHGIVSSLKGATTVDSAPGEGSTFHVVLPVVEIDEEQTEEDFAPVPKGNECVLFVDDEKDILKMEAHMLTSLGYEPVVAGSGDEALKIFTLNPDRFDILITDQVMPGLTGVELAKAVLEIRPELPIILCSGFSEAVSPQEAKAAGIREFMLKPIAMRTMAQAIRKVLGMPPPSRKPGAVAAASKNG
jgi:DNA-binding NtrC family response regulator